jgi:aspartyl-tRNA(Asn)/glutamyl-tRNA(Gln) amidotransferase subunit A
MKSFAFASIRQLREKISKKEISSRELLEYFLNRFKTFDSEVLSALEVFDAESIMREGTPAGLLEGIPGLVKDNICQKNRLATCASKILQGYRAPYDATATTRLKNQGALLVGRANMDEFAMGSSGETSAYQKSKNPWNLDYVPGGSSSGSAAAVAAGLVPWALGSETGGSVRLPAAFCNLVGLKPTYGLISRYGLIAYASSLDQIGIFSRTVYDNALVLSAIAGHDLNDSTSLPVQTKNYTQSLDGSIKKGLKIGIIENLLYAPGMDAEVVAAIEEGIKVFEKLGAQIVRIKMPVLDYSAAVYFIISRAEAASNLARFDGVRYGFRAKNAENLAEMYAKTRHDGFGAEVRARILIGNYVLSTGYADAFYNNAKKVQRLMRHSFKETFDSVDLVLMPTSPTPAFKFGAFDLDKLQMDLQDMFTCSVNLAGTPALSVPCGMSKNKLPIGFQLAGPHLSEELIFQTAHAYEQVTPWHTMYPEKFME